jgi:hypothetical protein
MPAAPAVTITRSPLTPASIRRMLEQHDGAGGGLRPFSDIEYHSY